MDFIFNEFWESFWVMSHVMSCHVNDRTSMQAETGFFDLGYVSDAEGCRGHGRWELV